jgi:EAL and modified HD-GYP domain-containing signal transduction protein
MAWLGEDECRRWLTVLLLPKLAPGIDQELLTAMIVRARFAESLVQRRAGPDTRGQTFIASLISQLVGVVGIEQNVFSIQYRLPDSLLRRISLVLARDEADEESAAIMLAERYYEGRWEECDILCKSQSFPGEDLAGLYLDAMDWGTGTSP